MWLSSMVPDYVSNHRKLNIKATKVMKRIMFFFLLASLSTLSRAYDVEIDGIYYNLVEEAKTAEVTYKTSSEASYSGNIVIPSSVMFNGVEYSVTNIGRKAFYKCTDLTSINIGNSVTSIGVDAFGGCNGLKKIIIGKSVTSIWVEHFKDVIVSRNSYMQMAAPMPGEL